MALAAWFSYRGRARVLPALALTCGLLPSALAVAAELPRAEPQSVGMAADALERLRGELDRLVEQGEMPGITAMVARRGKVVFSHATGLLDVQTGAPMRLDSLLRIYSMTKPVTSVAAMMLVEEGKLGLDDSLSRFFPGWRNMTVLQADGSKLPVLRPITARHLLTHTAGLAYGYDGDSAVDRLYQQAGLIDDWDYLAKDTHELVEKLADIPLLYQPGTRWHYSFATDVLGHLVERVSGQSLDVFLQERLFAPLGIADAYFDVPPKQLHRFGTDHIIGKDGETIVQDSPREDPEFIGVTFLSGGGGLVTTAADYMRFCLMLDGGGEFAGARILQPETVREMTRNQLPDGAGWDDGGFGLGFGIAGPSDEPGALSPGAYQWGGAAGTFFWIDPAERLIGIFMPQRIGMPGRIQNSLQQLVYEAITEPAP